MRRIFPLLLALLALASCVKRPDEPTVSRGCLTNYTDFPSKFVPARTVRVWTPSCYDPAIPCDVIYMHDGKMLFDAEFAWNGQEWRVDEVVDSLIEAGAIRPCIVVGIDNYHGRRIGEYCPDDIAEFLPAGARIYAKEPPLGNDYLRFLVEELKPFIDSTYSVRPGREHTFVMGSSCGGLISSYALCKYPEVFGGAACLSTNSTMRSTIIPRRCQRAAADAYVAYLREHLPEPNSHLLYFDVGSRTLDREYLRRQPLIDDTIRSLGWDDSHFQSLSFPGHSHSESAWSSRLPIPLSFLCPAAICTKRE